MCWGTKLYLSLASEKSLLAVFVRLPALVCSSGWPAWCLKTNDYQMDGISPLRTPYKKRLELQSAWIWSPKGANLFCLLYDVCSVEGGMWHSPISPPSPASHTLLWRDKWQLQSATSKNTTSLCPWQPSWRWHLGMCCQNWAEKGTQRQGEAAGEDWWGLYFTIQIRRGGGRVNHMLSMTGISPWVETFPFVTLNSWAVTGWHISAKWKIAKQLSPSFANPDSGVTAFKYGVLEEILITCETFICH